MTTNYPVVFEQEESGAISGYVPGLPLYVAADTRAQAERAMRGLLEAYFAEHGGRAPRATTRIKVARVEQGDTTRVVLVGTGALLGQRRSAAKAAAARANGAKGGRPRIATAAGARRTTRQRRSASNRTRRS